ncbi:MAG: S41 family peptidase [Armatimonadaceae bacterium]
MHPILPGICASLLLTLPALSVSAPAAAQLPDPQPKPAVGARMPALSPDGKRIAFVWRGDIWVGSTDGGRAYPVTSNLELDAYPVFSPDGKWLAFSSLRTGNWDIFVTPAVGGEARQITHASGSEIVSDWSPDGKKLIFSGERDVPESTLFSIDVQTRQFERLTMDYRSLGNPAYSPDGKSLVFQRDSFPWTRPRYNGSRAAQLWTMDVATGTRKEISSNKRQHLWPRYTADGKGIVVVTTAEETPNAQYLNKPLLKLADNEKRTPNLHLFPANGGKPRSLTKFVGDGVRCPTVARQSGAIAFEYGSDLYLMPAPDKEPKKLTFYCGADNKQSLIARETFKNSGVTEAEISPDGKMYAFVIQGDIWTIPVEQEKDNRNADLAKRLTDHPGFDRDLWWSNDGKTLYFVSDRNGNDGIFAQDVSSGTVKPVWVGSSPAQNPKVSPDGLLLGFWVAGPIGSDGNGSGGLYVAPTNNLTPAKRVVAIPGAAQGTFSFSPDGKWVAYTRRNIESYAYNIYIAPTDGSKEPVNVTRLNAFHSNPTWTPNGEYLFFTSNREDGLGVTGQALYVLPLKKPEAREDDLILKYEKAKSPVNTEIEWEDIHLRIRRIPTDPAPSGDLFVNDKGAIFFNSGGNAYQASFDGKNVRKLTSTGGVGNLRVSDDGNTIYYFRSGGLYRGRTAPPFPQDQIDFAAEWVRDREKVRQSAFDQFWLAYKNGFYDPNFHGRDWSAIRKRYEPLLESVATDEEFATLLNRMIGEVEASHSEVGAARGSGPQSPVTRNLGVYFDYSYTGPGLKVKEVPEGAPGSYPKTQIKPGEYIVEIDGTPVRLNEDLYAVLNDKGDRDFELLVNSTPSKAGARTVRYKALSSGEWEAIHYRNRILQAQRNVEKFSNGKVAYVHIQGMGSRNEVLFEKELYEFAEGKDALIIDVRFNGGGSIADNLLSWLAIKPYRIRFSRDDYPQNKADDFFFVRSVKQWNKPIVVLMNEYSLSNAEIFPYVMRVNGLAKLVGMPTPGYVISTGGLGLVDGTRARMPGGSNFRGDGSPMENLGEAPDYRVPWSTEDYLSKKDPQLEKAVEVLMGQIKK